jgi:hypothetical protein
LTGLGEPPLFPAAPFRQERDKRIKRAEAAPLPDPHICSRLFTRGDPDMRRLMLIGIVLLGPILASCTSMETAQQRAADHQENIEQRGIN